MTAPSQTAAASSKLMPSGLCASAPALWDADELRVRTPFDAEDLVTDRELAHGPAGCLDHSGELHAGNPSLGSAEPGEYPREERFGGTEATVRPGNGGGMDLDQNLVLLRDWTLDLFEP